jgi:DNA replication protein DnaC
VNKKYVVKDHKCRYLNPVEHWVSHLQEAKLYNDFNSAKDKIDYYAQSVELVIVDDLGNRTRVMPNE